MLDQLLFSEMARCWPPTDENKSIWEEKESKGGYQIVQTTETTFKRLLHFFSLDLFHTFPMIFEKNYSLFLREILINNN